MQDLPDDHGPHQQLPMAAESVGGMHPSDRFQHPANTSNPAAAAMASQDNSLQQEPTISTRPAATLENSPAQQSEQAAQPVAVGAGLSAEETSTLHAGHMPSEH